MKIKPGVSIRGIRPELVHAAVTAYVIYQQLPGKPELVITCCTDGEHGRKSLHYVGQAIDIRSRDMGIQVALDAVTKLREALGHEFDAVTETDHIHIEYQPKQPA